MKRKFISSVFVLLTVAAFSQSTRYRDADHFLLKGSTYEINHVNDTEGKTTDVQVIIYQNDDIYVAFNSSENNGTYEFYLPISYNYRIYYGGGSFVNKIVEIDSKQFPSEKKPRIVKLDVGVFKPIEGYAFEMMKEPYVKIDYNAEDDVIEPDMQYTEARTDLVVKYFKKIKKDMGKQEKNSHRLTKTNSKES